MDARIRDGRCSGRITGERQIHHGIRATEHTGSWRRWGAIGGQSFLWSGSQWLPMGTGMNGTVAALGTLSDGRLVAAGAFTTAGGTTANPLAVWSGETWLPLGSGLDGTVYAMLVMPNGELVVGGAFSAAGGTPAANIARWNGCPDGAALGGGVNASVHALAVGPAVPVSSPVVHSRWREASLVLPLVPGMDAASGPPLGLGNQWPQSSESAVLHDGSVRESSGSFHGQLSVAPACENIARSRRYLLASAGKLEVDRYVEAVVVQPNGDIVATGDFHTAGGLAISRIATWDGNSWFPLGSPGLDSIGYSLAVVLW